MYIRVQRVKKRGNFIIKYIKFLFLPWTKLREIETSVEPDFHENPRRRGSSLRLANFEWQRFFTVCTKKNRSLHDTRPSNIDSLCDAIRIDDSRRRGPVSSCSRKFFLSFSNLSTERERWKWNRLTCPCCSAARPLSDYSPWTDSCCCTHSSVSLRK